ncbi:MAG: Ig-like domain-containing protein [Lachnospiraceae bacterium]|nr:Ig-like domain-containing protein [Lachnospiraceae bacterium]
MLVIASLCAGSVPVCTRADVQKDTGSEKPYVIMAKEQSLKLNKDSVLIEVGKTTKLKANQKVTWKSSDKKKVSVSKKGLVKAKKRGEVTITAKSKTTGEVKKVKVYSGGYKITKKRFPDKGFRACIKDVFDRNKNGYLDKKEVEVWYDIDFPMDRDDSKTTLELYGKIKKISGLQCFPNLESICLDGVEGLESVDLCGCKKLVEIDEVGMNKITTLKMDNCPNLHSVLYSSNSLKYVSARNCPRLGQDYTKKELKKLKYTHDGICLVIHGNPKKIDLRGTPISNDRIRLLDVDEKNYDDIIVR